MAWSPSCAIRSEHTNMLYTLYIYIHTQTYCSLYIYIYICICICICICLYMYICFLLQSAHIFLYFFGAPWRLPTTLLSSMRKSCSASCKAPLRDQCVPEPRFLKTRVDGCGSKPLSKFGVGAPPSCFYYSADWDVHWGIQGFDPQPDEG